AVSGTHERIAGALGMRHHAEDVTALIENSGDIAGGAVGVVDIAEGHAIFGFKPVERALIREILTFAVGDGNAQNLALSELRSEWRRRGFGTELHFATDEFELLIAEQSAREQASFDQDLEPVADTEHQAAIRGELLNRLHDRRKARDGAAA